MGKKQSFRGLLNPKFHDLTGLRSGHLQVLQLSGFRGGRSWWVCQCDCGQQAIYRADRLAGGRVISCGCLLSRWRGKEGIGRVNWIHGGRYTRLYRIQQGIIRRCYAPAHPAFPRYGGKGIKMLGRWHDFRNFRTDLQFSYRVHSFLFGEARTSLDRIDNSRGYYPDNVRWATPEVQANNPGPGSYMRWSLGQLGRLKGLLSQFRGPFLKKGGGEEIAN